MIKLIHCSQCPTESWLEPSSRFGAEVRRTPVRVPVKVFGDSVQEAIPWPCSLRVLGAVLCCHLASYMFLFESFWEA